jgi:hypothetical protein
MKKGKKERKKETNKQRIALEKRTIPVVFQRDTQQSSHKNILG